MVLKAIQKKFAAGAVKAAAAAAACPVEAHPLFKMAPPEQRFLGHDRRGKTIDRFVFHEPAVAELGPTIRILQAKNLSVHYTIDRDGSILEHCPIERYTAHAGIPGKTTGYNTRSVGLEFINRYYGHREYQVRASPLYSGEFKTPLIKGIWVDRAWSASTKTFANPEREYIMLTKVQLEAGHLLTQYLLDDRGLRASVKGWAGISKDWRGHEVYNWGTQAGSDSNGVKPHAFWAHADGRVPAYYALLRDRGLSCDEAYERTVADASSMKRQTRLPV